MLSDPDGGLEGGRDLGSRVEGRCMSDRSHRNELVMGWI
jgi:hypothetical protein